MIKTNIFIILTLILILAYYIICLSNNTENFDVLYTNKKPLKRRK